MPSTGQETFDSDILRRSLTCGRKADINIHNTEQMIGMPSLEVELRLLRHTIAPGTCMGFIKSHKNLYQYGHVMHSESLGYNCPFLLHE